MRQIRVVVAISVLGGFLAAAPIPATAGGTGGECPKGLTQKLVKPTFQGGLGSRRRPLKISGFEARPSASQTNGGITTKSYIWGEGGRISGKTEYVVLCGKSTGYVPSEAETIVSWSVVGLIIIGLVGAIAFREVRKSKKLRMS